ncbi:hypothetical protein HPB47_020525 [Ixodes persulcatus]|uniref:Uncharacterized protein n=1 Tax=Ixodes persulcatus TaxID=34615 RepID=A0AC60QIP7_IXOPE|nr:hypothetical protein HPB47_020525 [Ixodes persulcatus]
MDPFGGRHRTAASFSPMGPSEPMGQKAAGSPGTAGSRGSLFKAETSSPNKKLLHHNESTAATTMTQRGVFNDGGPTGAFASDRRGR